MKKAPFFDFFNRRNIDFEQFLRDSVQDEDYIDWNQFVLPKDYGDAQEEYQAIRNSCAIFDVSPLRKYRIQGPGAGEFLDNLLTRPASTAASGRGIYVAFCDEDGSLKDDAILHKYADDDFLLLPADIDHSSHFQSLLSQRGIDGVSIVDCTESWQGMAIQGPLSATVLHQMGLVGIEHLKPFAIQDYPFAGSTVRVVRMGFTADLGYECWFDQERCEEFARGIQSARNSLGIPIPGYGLSALEACRLEGGFIVPGWDCSTEFDPQPGFERTPFDLGLGWLVKLDAFDFVGRDALVAQQQTGQKYSQRSFEMDSTLRPADGTLVYGRINNEDVTIGQINCSSWSWGLEKMIGNACLEFAYRDFEEANISIGDEIVNIRLSRGPLRKFEQSRLTPAPIGA